MSCIRGYNRRVPSLLLFTAVIFCLYSCASARVRENRLFAWVTDSARYFLLPPEYLETPMDNLQFISASYGRQNFHVIVLVRADETGLDMTMINEMGAGMGELIWRNGAISFSSSVFPRSVQPEYIVADFQLCFYDAKALGRVLGDAGLLFEETDAGRRIYNGNRLIIEITKTPNTVNFINHLRGYSYTLEGEF